VEEGVPFLGFIVYPQRRWLKRRTGVLFRRTQRGVRDRMLAAQEAGELPGDRVMASAPGWPNHVRFANTVGLRKTVPGEASRGLHKLGGLSDHGGSFV
jgi:hypothetical protein